MSRPPRVVAEPAGLARRVGDRRQLAGGVQAERRAPPVRRDDRRRRAGARCARSASCGRRRPRRARAAPPRRSRTRAASLRSARRPCAGGARSSSKNHTSLPSADGIAFPPGPGRRERRLEPAHARRRAVGEQRHAGAVDRQEVGAALSPQRSTALSSSVGVRRARHLRAPAHRAHDDAVRADADDAPAEVLDAEAVDSTIAYTLPSRPSASAYGLPDPGLAAIDVERRSCRPGPNVPAYRRRTPSVPSSMMIPAVVVGHQQRCRPAIASSERMSPSA